MKFVPAKFNKPHKKTNNQFVYKLTHKTYKT